MACPTPLTLHIGLQKTGTTLIQRSLRKLRPVLRNHGIIYIDRSDINGLNSLRGWVAFNKTKPELRPAFIRELGELVSEKIEQASGVSPVRHVLISNEALVGFNSPNYRLPFRPKAELAILEFMEALAPEDTRLVLYVRRQDRLIESAYMQRIHAGRAFTFEEYLARIDDGPIIDFENLVERLEKLPTVTKVTTRPFEFIGAGNVPFVADFLDAAGLPDVDLSPIADLPRSNPSYTGPAYQCALTINRHVSGRNQRAQVRKFLKDLFPVGEYPSAVLFQEAERQACLDTYREVNESFFRRRHPELPPDVYSTPEATEYLARHLSAR
jgi:hypothetical protein